MSKTVIIKTNIIKKVADLILTKVQKLCDSCGKELDEMKDMVGFDLELPDMFICDRDLCRDCYIEMKSNIINFLQRKGSIVE